MSYKDMDYDYTDSVPFYGNEYFIAKHTWTTEMDRLWKEAFQVTPMISVMYF